MFEQALKRLFLIFLPLFFITLAYFLVNKESQKNTVSLIKNTQINQNKNCDILFGVYPFPKKKSIKLQEATENTNFKNKKSKQQSENLKTGEFHFLTKSSLLKSIESMKSLPSGKTFFVWPLALNKEEEWIISEKIFFFLPSTERKEISHHTYKEMIDFKKEAQSTQTQSTQAQNLSLQQTSQQKNKPSIKAEDLIMTLENALSYTPKESDFLFILLGSDRQKIIKNLDKALLKTHLTDKGRLYVSSDNERLLEELYQYPFQKEFKILHSYKSLIRFEMLQTLSPNIAYEKFKGDGVIVPDLFSGISFQTLSFLKNRGKLIVFQKEPPYLKENQKTLQKASALISSSPLESFQEWQKNCQNRKQ